MANIGKRDRRIAFVTPRYGDSVVGGSEAVVREAAHGLADRGWDVEVLTTCALNHYTWANELPAGTTFRRPCPPSGRFATIRSQDNGPLASGFREKLYRQTTSTRPKSSPGSMAALAFPDLYLHLVGQGPALQRHRFFAIPVLVTLYCTGIAPSARSSCRACRRAVRLPALSRRGPGLLGGGRFLSEPEHQLAHRLAPVASHHAVIGAAVNIPESYDKEGFRKRHDLERPYVAHAAPPGRWEGLAGADGRVRDRP